MITLTLNGLMNPILLPLINIKALIFHKIVHFYHIQSDKIYIQNDE